jgi:hypothetical protein
LRPCATSSTLCPPAKSLPIRKPRANGTNVPDLMDGRPVRLSILGPQHKLSRRNKRELEPVPAQSPVSIFAAPVPIARASGMSAPTARTCSRSGAQGIYHSVRAWSRIDSIPACLRRARTSSSAGMSIPAGTESRDNHEEFDESDFFFHRRALSLYVVGAMNRRGQRFAYSVVLSQ